MAWAGVIGLVAGACGPKKPPPGFAPDPGLAARIQSIEVLPAYGVACPGNVISVSYAAVLDDGSRIPFSTRYDPDQPPELHVVMLRRMSPDATPRENGDWEAARDPLRSAMTGFRLNAALKVKPSANGIATVDPDYSCLRTNFEFRGAGGRRSGPGAPGPDVTVRIGMLSSPIYEKLVVASVAVGAAPPFYILGDGDQIPPADWISLSSRGGAGGRGMDGEDGAPGSDGETGCPGSPGGAGGAGGNGGPGGSGGQGGRVAVVAPEDDPFLAGLVDAWSVPGPGGTGGKPGTGGEGGEGGEAERAGDRRCRAGADGQAGPDGKAGPDGPPGPPSAGVSTSLVPMSLLYGPAIPPALADLLDHSN